MEVLVAVRTRKNEGVVSPPHMKNEDSPFCAAVGLSTTIAYIHRRKLGAQIVTLTHIGRQAGTHTRTRSLTETDTDIDNMTKREEKRRVFRESERRDR